MTSNESAGLAQSDIISNPLVLDEASQKAVEQTGEQVVDGIQFTEAEKAAAEFTYFLRHLKKEVGNLSAKGAARVLYRLAEFPLGDTVAIDEMGFKDKKEKLLFQLFYEINARKSVIMQEVKDQQAQFEPEKEKEDGGN